MESPHLSPPNASHAFLGAPLPPERVHLPVKAPATPDRARGARFLPTGRAPRSGIGRPPHAPARGCEGSAPGHSLPRSPMSMLASDLRGRWRPLPRRCRPRWATVGPSPTPYGRSPPRPTRAPEDPSQLLVPATASADSPYIVVGEQFEQPIHAGPPTTPARAATAPSATPSSSSRWGTSRCRAPPLATPHMQHRARGAGRGVRGSGAGGPRTPLPVVRGPRNSRRTPTADTLHACQKDVVGLRSRVGTRLPPPPATRAPGHSGATRATPVPRRRWPSAWPRKPTWWGSRP